MLPFSEDELKYIQSLDIEVGLGLWGCLGHRGGGSYLGAPKSTVRGLESIH